MNRVARAGEFLGAHGRDIDQARFAYHFAAGSRDDLLRVLGRYQNADGGFGNCLEADIKAPDSNPFATELALLWCYEDDVPRDHPILRRTVSYLEETQDDTGGWQFTEGVYAHDLAPWFAGWDFSGLDPACSIAGMLKALGLGSEELHERVRRRFVAQADPEDLLGDEFYTVQPYAYYLLPEIDEPERELYISGVVWWLLRQRREGKLADAQHFFEYVRAPGTYTARNLPQVLLTEQLDRLEAEQEADGGWPSPYGPAWRGPGTVQALLVLRAFGRL